jgi:hypothetical protein
LDFGLALAVLSASLDVLYSRFVVRYPDIQVCTRISNHFGGAPQPWIRADLIVLVGNHLFHQKDVRVISDFYGSFGVAIRAPVNTLHTLIVFLAT